MSLCLAAYQLIQEVVMIDLTEACLQTETGAATAAAAAAAAAECQRTSYDRPVLLCTEFMDSAALHARFLIFKYIHLLHRNDLFSLVSMHNRFQKSWYQYWYY